MSQDPAAKADWAPAPSRTSGRVTARCLAPLAMYAFERGLDYLSLLRESGIDPKTVPMDMVPFEQVAALWRRVEETTGEPDIGLRILDKLQALVVLLGNPQYVLIQVLAFSKDVRSGLECFTRAFPHLFNGAHLSARETLDDMRFELALPLEAPRSFTQFLTGMAVVTVRMFSSASATEVQLTGARPPQAEHHERTLGAPIRWDSVENGFTYSNAALALPLRTHNPEMLAEALRNAGELAADQVQLESVRDVISGALVVGTPLTNPEVAARLGMSVRSLARRLAEAGTSFRRLTDELRVGLAREQLATTTFSIAEIAARLGYSDASTFTRAFSRQAGKSPAAYRQDSQRSRD